MSSKRIGEGRAFPLLVGLTILALGCLATAGMALANNGVNSPAVGGVTADMVRAAAQQQVYDPPMDVFGNGGSCPDPVNYGFDYGDSVYVWLSPGGDMYFAIETHGNIGDSDQDGGYDTETATCGGHPTCVSAEADAFNNIFASGVESVTISVDRDCSGTSDLRFTLTGAGNMRADSVSVTLDALTGFFGSILGGQGTGWAGAPLQVGPDAVCVVQRAGVVVIRLANWNQYFQDNTPAHNFLPGISPTTFDWIVDSGNNSDFYTEDLVTGRFDISNPQVDLVKSVSRSQICASGDTTRFTLTVTNIGNTPLTDVILTDQLPAGLVYDDSYIDDPSNPIGAPNVVSNNLTWTGFTFAPGDSRTVSYRAVSDGCQGQVANNAAVQAQFDIDCLGGPVAVADFDSADVTCVEPCVTVSAPAPQSLCAGSPWSATFVVTNCGTVTENLSIVPTVGGASQSAVVRNGIAAGDTVHVDVSGILPGTCGPPIAVSCEATATLPGVAPQGCSDVDSDQATVSCTAACVTVADAPADSSCPGTDLWLEYVVTNCNGQGGAENMTFTGMYNGSPATVSPTSASNVTDGDTVHVKLLASLPVDCSPNGYLGTLTANAALATDAGCTDTDSGDGRAFCTNPNVDIVKSTSPTTTSSGSTVTLVVTNPSGVTLDPVQVSDHLPPGMLFDDTQTIGGTCLASVDHVTDLGGIVWVYFTDFTLGPGQSCTITYDVDCGEFDGQARIDTAYVDAWCDGTFGIANPVSDSDTAVVVCEGGQACPRTIGFWRQQCAQKGNGSTKVCEAGMESLWVCVINATDVVQWRLNDGGYETTAYLRTLSPSDLFAHLCSQLQGPRPMTLQNMAEIQYLGLMLNYCSEAVSGGIPVQNSFTGTVGAAIDSIEAAINSGVNIGYWKTVADEINNGIGVLAPACDNESTFFQNLRGCALDAPGSGQTDILKEGFDPNALVARSYPNPVLPGSGTVIYYQIPSDMGRTTVELSLYDIAGRLVKRLVSEGRDPGSYTVNWNLTDQTGSQVPSGVYFYRLRAGSEVFTQKMLVVRH